MVNHQPPLNLVELGQVFDAKGLKGHIKVRPYSQDPVSLLACKHIFLQGNPAQMGSNQTYLVKSAKGHSGDVVMLLEGVDDRDAALALKGLTVMLSREQFPDAGANSYYWIDLIGCEVENLQGVHLGKVEDISEFGAHPVMKIGDELIPFVEAIVKSVDLKNSQSKGKIVVDWQPNWS
jgi:16S rRNA processing protein RimM